MTTTKPMLLAAALVLAVTATAPALAATPAPDEARLLAALKKAHPGTRFTGVAPTPLPGLYEVWMGPNMALVFRNNLRYLVFGRVFDTQTMTDLTAPRLAQAQRLDTATEQQENEPTIAIADLPLADAIRRVRGDGSRTLIVFSDPACPYCKRLETELERLDNVTIHTFLVPFQGVALPAAIWCAADRQDAWHRFMLQGDPGMLATATQPTDACPHPLERNLALARRLKVRGTPTMFYVNGQRSDGYADAAVIEARLAATPPTQNSATRPQEARK
ncbi:MAG TPA: disulfide isomerase [Oxalobacteraceae bacterium]|nr:disulfide isomerase [Oxalobacteraceae bacterium]